MPDLIVQRGSGTSPGEDVVESLLTTDSACLSRGRIELDEGSGLREVHLDCVYRDGVLLGDLVSLYDPLLLAHKSGVVTSITHSIEGADVVTTLVIKVPSEFSV